MPRYTLEQLKEQELQLRARIRLVADAERKQERAKEARKKVILGTLMLTWLEEDKELRDRVTQALPDFLKRDADKALFFDQDGRSTLH